MKSPAKHKEPFQTSCEVKSTMFEFVTATSITNYYSREGKTGVLGRVNKGMVV